MGPDLITAGDARVFVDGEELEGVSSVSIDTDLPWARELSAFDRDVLVAMYRDVQDHRRAWPESVERGGPEKVAEAMYRLRAAGLVGWLEGEPKGLTRKGALRAAELDRERTRERQVRNYLADEQVRLERLRSAIARGDAIHEAIGTRARELARAQAALREALAQDCKREERN